MPVDLDGDGLPAELDCDDTDTSIHLGASELCDGLDNGCDGAMNDDPVDASTWYLDHDGDGVEDPRYTREECATPTGYTAGATDCDDLDSHSYPGGEWGGDFNCGDVSCAWTWDTTTVTETSEIRLEVVEQGINEDVIFCDTGAWVR